MVVTYLQILRSADLRLAEKKPTPWGFFRETPVVDSIFTTSPNLLKIILFISWIVDGGVCGGYLDPDQETWSVRFPHDYKKVLSE